jgi:hypothetical protein
MTLAASIAGSGEFTPTELQQLLDALPKTPTSSVAMETGIPLDLAAQTIPGILDPKIRADEGVYGMETREVTDPAATVRDLNALYLEDLGNLGKPWATRNQTVRDGLIRRTSGLSYSRSDTPLQILRDMLRSKQSNIGGKMLIAEMAQRNNIAWSFVFRQNMHEVVRLQLALAIFRGKHGGTLPRRLEDLVKDGILKELPVDHFTDESFIYDPLREIFYSAGEDMIDSGGSVPATANEKALDYIYTIPTGRGGAH